MNILRLSLLCLACFGLACAPPLTSQPASSPQTSSQAATAQKALSQLEIDGHILQVEVALTAEEQAQGLMRRTSMPENQGMLFVFSPSKQAAMWMKDTPLALSVAFIDEQAKIVAIKNMTPNTNTLHIAPGPVRYALETNLGWFEKRGIAVGASVSIPNQQALLSQAKQ